MKLDAVSFLVTVDPNVRFVELETGLNEEGLTLGYAPQSSVPRLTMRRILEERIPNRYGLHYGEVDDLCVSLKVRWKTRDITTKKTPRSATGPDLKKIFIGSRGRYGKIQEVVLRISPYALKKRKLKGLWKTVAGRGAFERRLWASGVRPFSLRREGSKGLVIDLGGRGDLVRAQKDCLKRLAEDTGGRMV